MHLIINYAIAMANLYGIYDKALLLDVYNDQNGQNMTQAELRKHFKDAAFALKRAEIVLRDDEIIKSEIIRNDSYEELMRLKWGKDYYVPERKDLLNYQDDKYIEPSPQFDRLKAAVKRYIGDDFAETADQITDNIALICRTASDPQRIFNYIDKFGMAFYNEDDYYALAGKVAEFYSATRSWPNNGYSPNDLEAFAFDENDTYLEDDMYLGVAIRRLARSLETLSNVYDYNQQFVLDAMPTSALNEQLQRYTVKQLKEIAKLLDIKHVSTLRKVQLVEKLADALIEYADIHLPSVLPLVTPYEMKIIKASLKNDFVALGKELIYVRQILVSIGCAQISYFEGDYYYSIADEIKPIIKSILRTKNFRCNYYLRRVGSMLKNIVPMYGVLSVNDAIELMQHLEPELTAKQTLHYAIVDTAENEEDFEFVNGYIVTSILLSFLEELEEGDQSQKLSDIVSGITRDHEIIPLNPLNIDDYLSYISSDNIEQTTALKEIEKLLLDHMTFNNIANYQSKTPLYDVLYMIDFFAKQALPLSFLHGVIATYDFKLDNYHKFDQLYSEHVKQTRSWLIRGHNKESLTALGLTFEDYVPSVKSGTVVKRTKKIGRNDPCPCGSGKKYKKCCLKLN